MSKQIDGRIDGHEAYRDDPEYTAPEMEPGKGETVPSEAEPELAVLAGTGMTIGAAGGALAGEVLVEEVQEERAETSLNPDDSV